MHKSACRHSTITSVVKGRVCVITRKRDTRYANEARGHFCRCEPSARELPECTQNQCDFSFQRKLKSPPLAFSRKWKRIETNGDPHNSTAYKYGIKRKFLPCQIRILSCRFLSILRNITGMEFKWFLKTTGRLEIQASCVTYTYSLRSVCMCMRTAKSSVGVQGYVCL